MPPVPAPILTPIRAPGVKKCRVMFLRGIVPPLATPLKAPNRLDDGALEALIERVLAAGVNGLFLLGTTGEGPALSYAVRRKVIRRAITVNRGRVPILISVTDTAWDEALALAKYAADCGADAIVAAPPCYFPFSQEDVRAFLGGLAEASPLPVYLYDIPSHARNRFEVETVVALSESPKILGIKDSTGDLDNLRALLAAFRDRPDFSILIGPEELLHQAVPMGVHGGVTGGANIHPRLYVDLYADPSEQLQAQVMDISRSIYSAIPGPSAYLRGMKTALAELGIGNGTLAAPWQPLEGAPREAIRACLRRQGLV